MLSSSRTRFRLFSLAGIPVFISRKLLILLTVITLVFVYKQDSFLAGLAVGAACFLSLLIHEFGHATLAKIYGLSPQIILGPFWGIGCSKSVEKPHQSIFLIIVGPIVQIIAGCVLLFLSNYLHEHYTFPLPVETFFSTFIFFSIIWGALNLFLPILPFDGGHLLCLTLSNFVNPRFMTRFPVLKMSMVVVAVFLILSLCFGQIGVACILGYILLENYLTFTMLKKLKVDLPVMFEDIKKRAAVLFEFWEIEKQFADENWLETARLCHILRDANRAIPPALLDRMWYMLGVSAFRLGDYQEALQWLKRASKTDEVERLIAEAEEKLAG